MRQLTKVLALVSLVVSAEGYPLSIGGITLNSALNQNLNAEIALYLEDNESISDFRIAMAPVEKFDEVGLPWTAMLSKIRFNAVENSEGSVLIKLSSDEAIKELFISFLVQIGWPSGMLYKEFTVLVDPPATYRQATIPTSIAGSAQNMTVDSALAPDLGSKPSNLITAKRTTTTGTSNFGDTKGQVQAQTKVELSRQNQGWRKQMENTVTAPIEPSDQLKLLAPEPGKVDEQAQLTSKNIKPSANASNNGALNQQRKLTATQVMTTIKDEKLAARQAAMVAELFSEPATGEARADPVISEAVMLAQKLEPEPEITTSEPKPKPEAVKPKPTVADVAEVETGRGYYYAWLAVIFVLIAVLVSWLWRRKKLVEEATVNDSVFSSAFTSELSIDVSEINQVATNLIADDVPFQSGTLDESSILSEFTQSSADAFAIEETEVDPIAETNVYLAYGYYQQAEALIRQAIKDQPDRDECKLKLLEIYQANENTEDFEKYATELSAKDQDPDFWARVVEMGAQICPDLAIFKQ